MHIKIREAIPSDAVSIDQLCSQLGYESQLNRTTTSLQFIINEPSHTVFIAETNDEIVGWIHVFIAVRLESESFAEIGGMVVDVRHRKNGIGTLFIRHAQKWALSLNVSKLRVRCNSIRKETHDFYLQRGFQNTKEQKVFDMKLADH